MMNESFSWVHIVKGRPRHPASQGAVERSHAPYKKAILAKMKERQTEDWVHWMHVVQCEVNNRPSRSRGYLTPYSLYFNQTNTLSYADSLGPVHKEAKTEYGLRLAKMVLDKVKELVPARVMSTDEVRYLIRTGDTLFVEVSQLVDDDVDSKITLTAQAVQCLQQFNYQVSEEDMGEIDENQKELPNFDYPEEDYQNDPFFHAVGNEGELQGTATDEERNAARSEPTTTIDEDKDDVEAPATTIKEDNVEAPTTTPASTIEEDNVEVPTTTIDEDNVETPTTIIEEDDVEEPTTTIDEDENDMETPTTTIEEDNVEEPTTTIDEDEDDVEIPTTTIEEDDVEAPTTTIERKFKRKPHPQPWTLSPKMTTTAT
jgi:hypothetical protein